MRNGLAQPDQTGRAHRQTSLEKALELCETLAGAQRGLTLSDLSRSLRAPAPTVHRLLAVLKRRGYVRQDEDTSRYSLTLKMLDLSFRWLGRSELRLHAYPLVREFVLRTGRTSVHRRPGHRRGHLRVVHGPRRGGHAHRLRTRHARALRRVRLGTGG